MLAASVAVADAAAEAVAEVTAEAARVRHTRITRQSDHKRDVLAAAVMDREVVLLAAAFAVYNSEHVKERERERETRYIKIEIKTQALVTQVQIKHIATANALESAATDAVADAEAKS